jgi:hypothetical protein
MLLSPVRWGRRHVLDQDRGFGLPCGVVKGIEARERIGLHDADITGEMFLGMLTGARSRTEVSSEDC